ncbi:MAG TPA: ATPase [Porphyromonadaceae bacterium]|nr:ATPase [Porphyromonadaceae bacterium]
MIESASLTNYGPIRRLDTGCLGRINLLIGPNRSGKTFFLKALYSAIRTIELYRRGKNIESDKEILFKKLYWTFQTEKIGNIVRRPGQDNLSFNFAEIEGGTFSYTFSPSAEKQVVKVSNTCQPRETNSIILPAKEILSLLDTIVYDREVRQSFGFDDTYYDLAKALTPTLKGRNVKVFSKIRERLETATDGRLVFSKEKHKWVFKQGNIEFDISLTSEGTKKIAILDTLLGNHFLSKESVVFIDEPEAGLHPNMVVELLDIITILANEGMQFFIATHSYFVIKKLYLIAQSEGISIPVISFGVSHGDDNIRIENLKQGMPDNSIIDEAIRLYREEMSL